MKAGLGMGVRMCGVLSVLVGLTGGCVSLDKYRQLEFAERNCNAERERLAGDLANCQVQTKDLQGKLGELEGTLDNKNKQMQILEDQARAAQRALDEMTKVYKELAARPIPSPEILVKPLPAELDKALRDFAAKYPDMVQYDGERGVLKFGSDVLFDLGSDAVKAEAIDGLKELAGIIGSPAAEEFDVVVVGHTDNVPIVKPETMAKHPTNWHLSAHRAIAVMNVLRDGGVAPIRAGVMGYSEYRPLAPNDSPANRAKNRRVEVYLVPKQAVGAQASETLRSEGAAKKKPEK